MIMKAVRIWLGAVALAAAGALTAATGAAAEETLGRAELSRVSKSTQGAATLVKTDGGVELRFSDDFKTGRGPDVLVLLHTSESPSSYAPSDYVSLGLMKTFRGAQTFKVPEGVDLSAYKSVVLWCRRFNVTFGAGALAADGS